ncbi:MAG: hypothetical protein V1774_01645 [Candidatus Eisenbacteria bacterium]
MGRSSKPFLILFGSLVLLLVCAGIALAISVQRAGMICVDVEATGPGGCDVRGLRLPGFLVNGAIRCLPVDVLCEAKAEAAWVHPFLRQACRTLQRTPDFALVEVDGPNEQVRITKRGNDLLIHVESDQERVHLVIPIRTLDALASRLSSS